MADVIFGFLAGIYYIWLEGRLGRDWFFCWPWIPSTWGRGKPLRQIRVIQIVCVVDWLPLRDTSQSDLIVELGFYWCLHLFSPSRRLPNSSWSMCQLRDLELFISRRSMKGLYWILFEFIGYDGQPYGPFTLGACPRNPNPDFFSPTIPMIVGFNTSATNHHHLVVIPFWYQVSLQA